MASSDAVSSVMTVGEYTLIVKRIIESQEELLKKIEKPTDRVRIKEIIASNKARLEAFKQQTPDETVIGNNNQSPP